MAVRLHFSRFFLLFSYFVVFLVRFSKLNFPLFWASIMFIREVLWFFLSNKYYLKRIVRILSHDFLVLRYLWMLSSLFSFTPPNTPKNTTQFWFKRCINFVSTLSKSLCTCTPMHIHINNCIKSKVNSNKYLVYPFKHFRLFWDGF